MEATKEPDRPFSAVLKPESNNYRLIPVKLVNESVPCIDLFLHQFALIHCITPHLLDR